MTRDAVALIESEICGHLNCQHCGGEDGDKPRACHELAPGIFAIIAPHFAAREAAAVASAVLAEREACACLAEMVAAGEGEAHFRTRLDRAYALARRYERGGEISHAIAARIRARSTQESGR